MARVLACAGADRLFGALNGSNRAPLILGYHRVVKQFEEMARSSIPSMLITTRTLEEHIDWVARRYRFTTLDEIGARLEAGEPFDERLAALTFDDGYADIYENALPLIERKGIPAAVFVVTDLIGRRSLQIHDRLYLQILRARRSESTPLFEDPVEATRALLTKLPQEELLQLLDMLESRSTPQAQDVEALRPLDWEMLGRMRRAGITIGSHTRTHALLALESPAKVRDEVEGSRAALERRLGIRIEHFAYPDGQFDGTAVAAVKTAGYRFAYGICPHGDPRAPLLTIRRRLLWENACYDGRHRFSPSLMSCNINAVFDPFAPCRRDHGGFNGRVLGRSIAAGDPPAARRAI
jgi:peptidoglycan/xylan/chitin deacetylase (PgdA/CDA1 family)